MKTNTCIICSNAKGKRVCKINNNSLICPVCCAKTRTNDCEKCVYYIDAQKHAQQKSKKFIMEIDPEVNNKVDHALAAAEKGNIKTGEGILSTLLEKFPHIDMVQYGMGVICLMKNQQENAITYFDKATEINPYFAEAWFNKGVAHQKRLELAQVIKSYRKVIEIGDYSENFVIQAKSFIRDLEKKIKRSSGLNLDEYLESMDIYNEAYASMKKMEWDKAITGFKKVLSKDHKHTQSFGNLGICYAHLGEKQKALAAFDKALELDPNYEPAIINKRAVSSLSDGERLTTAKLESVDYYKDFSIKKKSLLKKIFK